MFARNAAHESQNASCKSVMNGICERKQDFNFSVNKLSDVSVGLEQRSPKRTASAVKAVGEVRCFFARGGQLKLMNLYESFLVLIPNCWILLAYLV